MVLVAKKKKRKNEFDGAKLRELRNAGELSQSQLAVKVGIHVMDVSRYERGVMTPSFDVACRLADALGVDVSAFRDQDE